jgi:MFS family permease
VSSSDEQRPNSLPPLPGNVKVLGMASLLNDIASEMIFPLLPQFLLTVAGGNRFYLGIMEGLADTVASLLKLWSGSYSDRLGNRKGFVVCGYILAALIRPLTGLATASWHVLSIRTTDRIGKGIRTAPRDALIAESTVPEMRGKAFGFHRGMDHLGAAIGPLLATAFLYFWPNQLRTLFLLTLLPGLSVAALVIWGLREPPSHTTPAASLPLTFQGFDRRFSRYLLALIIFTLGNSSDAFLLVRAGELGVPLVLLPIMWCAFHSLKSAGNMFAGSLVDRVGPRPMIFAGWTVYAVIYIAFAFATNAWHVWILFLSYALFYALTEPAEKTFVTQLVPTEHKGRAFGWFNFAIGIASLPASVLFGWLYENYGALTAFGSGAVLAALAAVLLIGVQPTPSK